MWCMSTLASSLLSALYTAKTTADITVGVLLEKKGHTALCHALLYSPVVAVSIGCAKVLLLVCRNRQLAYITSYFAGSSMKCKCTQ